MASIVGGVIIPWNSLVRRDSLHDQTGVERHQQRMERMTNRSSREPAPTLIAEIRRMIAVPKTWVASGEMKWIDAGGRPAGYRFQERLAMPDGSQPGSLYVKGYYKPASVSGSADKVSFSLIYGKFRVIGVDEDGVGGHYNSAGVGRPYYGKRVGFPHFHSPSDDSVEGYAEPLPRSELTHLWEFFATEAGISDPPAFVFPPIQYGLPV